MNQFQQAAFELRLDDLKQITEDDGDLRTGAPATAGKTDAAIEIAKMLLSNGADLRLRNKNGKLPIDYVKTPEMMTVLSAHATTG